jgi:hypothetical protein
LCLRLGIDDPEQWLENCSVRKLNIWRAYYAIEPWGDEQRILAAIAAAVRQLALFKIESDKTEKLIELLERVAACYMPGEWIGQPEIKQVDPIEQFQKRVEMLYG